MAEGTFDDITERLDQIIAQVRSKDTWRFRERGARPNRARAPSAQP